MKQVKLSIDKNGKATIETAGYVGGECKDVIAQVQKAMGAQTLEEETKPEFFGLVEQGQSLEQGGGSW